MKTFMVTVAATMAMFATTATAKTVYYPKHACAEIVSQEYSTGGGDKTFQILEILCKDENGKYTGFVATWGSAAGFFGMGRIASEKRFDYVPYDGNALKVD